MKRFISVLVACVILAPACIAESSADRFLSSLSDTWDSFLDMAGDAGKGALKWAEEKGVTAWVEEAAGDISAWARENGLTDWATDALGRLSDWFDESGIAEWATDTSREIQAYIEENRPAIEAWLAEAGQEVRDAWDTLVHADRHTEEEVEEARDTVADSLREAQAANP